MNGKKCIKCQAVKNIAEFYRHSAMADGHLNKCKECTKADARTNRAKNIDYIRAYDRERAKLPHRREKSKMISERWRAIYPIRRAAHVLLNNAVRSGKVVPWPGCAACDATSVEAHHPDYDQPLSVVWLCPAHHKQCHHMKIDAEKN